MKAANNNSPASMRFKRIIHFLHIEESKLINLEVKISNVAT